MIYLTLLVINVKMSINLCATQKSRGIYKIYERIIFNQSNG